MWKLKFLQESSIKYGLIPYKDVSKEILHTFYLSSRGSRGGWLGQLGLAGVEFKLFSIDG